MDGYDTGIGVAITAAGIVRVALDVKHPSSSCAGDSRALHFFSN